MVNSSANTRKIIIGISAVVGFTLVGIAIGHWVIPYFESKNSQVNIEELLHKRAEAINKKVPMAVDAETRLDGAEGAGREFRYRYTLINYDANTINARDIQNSSWQKLLNNLCTSRDLKEFRDNDVTVMYSYFGRDGRQIATLSTSPSQCGRG